MVISKLGTAGIGALADPVRRALYQYVAAQPDAVGREAAAQGTPLTEAVHGAADGLGCQSVEACLAPAPGQCCIKARLTGASTTS